MFVTYVLYSKSYNKIYVGMTSNLEQRILSHNKLGTKGWTIKYRPWSLIHMEEFQSKGEAVRREKQLKSSMGRDFIRRLLNERS